MIPYIKTWHIRWSYFTLKPDKVYVDIKHHKPDKVDVDIIYRTWCSEWLQTHKPSRPDNSLFQATVESQHVYPIHDASVFLSYPECISVSLLPMMHQHFSPNRDASAFLSYPGCISISFLPRMHQHFSPTLDASKVNFWLCFNSADQQLNELLDFSSNKSHERILWNA